MPGMLGAGVRKPARVPAVKTKQIQLNKLIGDELTDTFWLGPRVLTMTVPFEQLETAFAQKAVVRDEPIPGPTPDEHVKVEPGTFLNGSYRRPFDIVATKLQRAAGDKDHPLEAAFKLIGGIMTLTSRPAPDVEREVLDLISKLVARQPVKDDDVTAATLLGLLEQYRSADAATFASLEQVWLLINKMPHAELRILALQRRHDINELLAETERALRIRETVVELLGAADSGPESTARNALLELFWFIKEIGTFLNSRELEGYQILTVLDRLKSLKSQSGSETGLTFVARAIRTQRPNLIVEYRRTAADLARFSEAVTLDADLPSLQKDVAQIVRNLPNCGELFVKEFGVFFAQKQADVESKAQRFAKNGEKLKDTAVFFMGGKKSDKDPHKLQFVGDLSSDFITPILGLLQELVAQFKVLDDETAKDAQAKADAAKAAKKVELAAALKAKDAPAGAAAKAGAAGGAEDMQQAILQGVEKPLVRRGHGPSSGNSSGSLPQGPMADLLNVVRTPRTRAAR